MSQAAVIAHVTGRVQGVAFRAWTQRRAQSLGLAGWVRNEPDGSVRAYIVGDETRVAEMIAALHEGPSLARVTSVTTEEADMSDAPDDFSITG